jgi:hypothetical protein
MNKKIITALIALTLIVPATTHAVDAPKTATLAIIDTAIDTSLPLFSGKIVHEVCILEWNSCPNGTSFMEGPGAATLPLNIISKNGFDHGTQMASAAVLTNPNLNIVFIRIIGNTVNGSRQITNEITSINAMNWVLKNKDKFNIKAVSMAQGHHNMPKTANYCPVTPSTENAINSLLAAGIPTFLPAGNLRDMSRVSWPSCIPSAFSISASAIGDGVASYTNYDKNLTDFFAIGSMQVFLPGGKKVNTAGTSVSVNVAGALWVYLVNKNPSYTYQQILDLLNSKSLSISNSKVKGKLISAEEIVIG